MRNRIKRFLLCIVCVVILSISGYGFSKNITEEAYATYEYQNKSGEMAEIIVTIITYLCYYKLLKSKIANNLKGC